jgi:hypothetical protein
MKKEYYVIPRFPEFNTVVLYNLLITEVKEYEDCIFHVMVPESQIVLFGEFDRIHVYPKDFTGKNYYINKQKYDNENKDAEELLGYNEYVKYVKNFFNGIEITEHPDLKVNDGLVYNNKFMVDGPPYDFLFKNLTKFLLNGDNTFLVKPLENDYLKVGKILNNLTKGRKKIVCINGRLHTNKEIGRDDTLIEYINKFIENGYFVVNNTIRKPNIYPNNDDYIEIDGGDFSYSENLSYFLNSNIVVSIYNAGGISTHLMTQSNILMKQTSETWVGNTRFGYGGDNMVSARKKKNILTDVIDIGSLGDYYNVDKISGIDFFDTTKIIR